MMLTTTPRKMQVVNSASSNLMHLDLDHLDYLHRHSNNASYEASPSLFPSSA